MSKPMIHAISSARKFGGSPEFYLDLHESLDSSKGTIADNRHRALTHNAWYLMFVLPKIFGNHLFQAKTDHGQQLLNAYELAKSNLKSLEAMLFNDRENITSIPVRSVGEQHVLEDYGGRFIPSASDFLNEIEMKEWMMNGVGTPPSCAKLFKGTRKFEVVD